MRLAEMIYTEEEMQELREENRLLKNEIAWLKDHTKYNGITEEYYIDGTMTATEAKLRLQQAEDNKNYVSKLEEENKMLHEGQGRLHRLWSKDTKHIAELEEENKTLYKKLQEIGENNFELKKENKKLQEKVNTYSEEYGKLREEKKKLKGEEIVKKLYTLIDNLTLIADNGIYIYSRDEIREYIEGLILGIQGKSDF